MKKSLIIVNPISGIGIGKSVFCDYIEPKMKEKCMDYTVVYTSKKNQSREIIGDSSQWKCIIVIGGDGTLSEVISVLEIQDFICPVGCIPAGSGNGLVKSILYRAKMDYSVSNACDIVLDGNFVKMDLIDIKYKKKTIPCFLAVSWCMISDIDLGTEWLRMIGSFRFTLGAIWAVIKKREYIGSFTYEDIETGEHKIVNGPFLYFWACNTSHQSSDVYSEPEAKIDDGLIHISYMTSSYSYWELLNVMLSLESGLHNVMHIKTKKIFLSPTEGRITVDGEEIPCCDIEMTIKPSVMNILS